MKYLFPLAALLLIGCSSEPQAEPVRVGLDGPQLDACASVALIASDAVPVHAAPDAEAPLVTTLASRTPVIVCDYKEGWQGIVFAQDNEDCGVSSPIDSARDYDGPCLSGWIPEDTEFDGFAG